VEPTAGRPDVAEIAVLGGGPSGAAAARLLASWRHDVVLIRRPGSGPRLAESIPPSTRKLFDAFGLSRAIDDARFQPWRGNIVRWGGSERCETFPPGSTGHHVIRSAFDRVLLTLAADAGARIVNAAVRDVVFDDEGVRVRTDGGAPAIHSQFVVDCSGRSGVLARALHLRRFEAGPRTIALSAAWRWPGAPPLDSTYALIESYADGWLWSIPVSADRRYVTVMIDPRATDLDRRGGAERAYLSEIAKAVQSAAMLSGGAIDDGPWGFDASLYTSSRFSGPRFLLAGDAGATLDPLSSFGVKKALASAWLASVVAHTCLARPAMRDTAVEFFDRRERAVYARYRHTSQTFSSAAAAAHQHRFWTDRANAELVDEGAEDEAVRLRTDPDVLRAFARLRERPTLGLRRSDRARIERRPGIAGREIVMQDCLVTEQFPDGVRFLRGVDLPHMIDLAPGHDDAGDLFEAYNRTRAPVALPDFLGALAVLVAWGALDCPDTIGGASSSSG
jgi:flavin-dependent dehydrogenase